MKHLYNGIATLLQQIPSIRWIDLDTGQLEYFSLRPGIDFPAALIDISYPQCDNVGGTGEQRCSVNINVRLAFEVWSESNMSAPDQVREAALNIYDLINDVKQKLHNKRIITGETLYRVSVASEKREDGIKVFSINFRTKTTE